MKVMEIIKANKIRYLHTHNFYITLIEVMGKLCSAKLLKILRNITYITSITLSEKVQYAN